MAHYYFHLRTAAGLELTDDEGDDLPGLDDAEQHAIESAKDLMKASSLDWRGASFEVYDDRGCHVVTVWFREVARLTDSGHRSSSDDQHA
jgi:hypothetical protein